MVLNRDKMAALLADEIFERIFLTEKFQILIRIPLKFIPQRPIHSQCWLR